MSSVYVAVSGLLEDPTFSKACLLSSFGFLLFEMWSRAERAFISEQIVRHSKTGLQPPQPVKCPDGDYVRHKLVHMINLRVFRCIQTDATVLAASSNF